MIDLEPRLADAFGYALEAHADQRRKGSGAPYAAHLLEVCALVLEDGGGEDEAVAALLHDVAEDQGGRPALAELEARFGPHVAGIVEACSDTLEQPKPRWWPRKRAYVDRVRSQRPPELRVSLADKVANARALVRDYRTAGEALWQRFHPDSDQVWYLGALLDAFRRRPEAAGPLLDELERAAAELERLTLPRRRPVPGSYRVAPRPLYAGPYPADPNSVAALLAAGVTLFLDLTEDGERAPYDSRLRGRARHERHPIADFGVPTDDALGATLDALDAALAAGETVYLHCAGGIGRTGTVVGCFLVRHGADDDEALFRTAASRRGLPGSRSPETEAQRALIARFGGRVPATR